MLFNVISNSALKLAVLIPAREGLSDQAFENGWRIGDSTESMLYKYNTFNMIDVLSFKELITDKEGQTDLFTKVMSKWK